MTRAQVLLVAGLVAAVVLAAMVAIAWSEQAKEVQARRLSVVQSLGTLRADIEGTINATNEGLRSLAEIESTTAGLSGNVFSILANALIRDRPHIRNMALSRGSVVAYVYPIEGNEQIVGLDYRNLPETQWPAYVRAMESGQAVLAGPVELVQGGQAVIVRIPIVEVIEGQRQSTGMVSAPIMLTELFRQIGIDFEALPYAVALRGADGLGAAGGPILGDPDLFDRDPEVLEIEVPGGTWQIAAVPREGWATLASGTRNLGIVGVILAGLAFAAVYRGGAMARERQDHAARLADSENRYRTMVSALSEGVMMVHADGRVLSANPRAEAILGLGPGELDGLSPSERNWEAIREDGTPIRPEAMPSLVVLRTGQPAREQVFGLHRRDGTRVWVSANGEPVVNPIDGSVEAAIVSFTDITDQRQAEDTLRHAQKMEAIGQLTGGIAHDFNNLLTIVMGNIELSREKIDAPDVRKAMATALKAAQRGADITRKLLAFGRRSPLHASIFDVNSVIDAMQPLLRTTLDERVEIRLDPSEDAWPVHTDQSQLESALLNLVLNARDAMAGGGQLTISTGNARLPDDHAGDPIPDIVPGDYVRIEVADTGSGMSDATRNRAFEPFFTTKDVGQGSGLGLSMVYGFASQSRGTVTIESREGAGTTVRLYLPRAAAGAAATERPNAPAAVSRGAGERILVVEDEPDVLEFVIALVESIGYRVVAATDGPSALEILRTRGDIALILSDVKLPGGLTGPELTRQAQALHPGLKAILMSGYPRQLATRDGIADGRQDILTKPFSKAEIAARLRAALED